MKLAREAQDEPDDSDTSNDSTILVEDLIFLNAFGGTEFTLYVLKETISPAIQAINRMSSALLEASQ